ncbi:MAG: hypothetical protein HY960_12700 [Ignavibacteriae bacterium]|nr:hypothetical protein [Ignavibacteriota bacterium]
MATRFENEKKFNHWIDHEDGTRTYWFDVQGKAGWFARYVKKVSKEEITFSFHQEIYDDSGILVERHEKYPIDKGHQQLKDEL